MIVLRKKQETEHKISKWNEKIKKSCYMLSGFFSGDEKLKVLNQSEGHRNDSSMIV